MRGGHYCNKVRKAIVITASGCGLMVHEYASLLATDRVYADKACIEISARCMDLGKFMYGLRHQLIRENRRYIFR